MDDNEKNIKNYYSEILYLIDRFNDHDEMLDNVELSTEAAILHDMAFCDQDEGLWIAETDGVIRSINKLLLQAIKQPNRRYELMLDLFDLLCKSISEYKEKVLYESCKDVFAEHQIDQGIYPPDPHDEFGVLDRIFH